MSSHLDGLGRLPQEYMTPGFSSITDFLSRYRPELLPGKPQLSRAVDQSETKHGTTVVAATHADGVVMAGDRRATMGNVISQRDIEKVFQADEYSVVGIAGTAGMAVEIVRLFQLEMEHYEKIEGTTLSLDGKANRLSTMIRSNLSMAMQGLAVVPLFAGYDVDSGTGRIFSYDVSGGRAEDTTFQAQGSGSIFAKGALKKLYREGASESDTILAVLHAIYDAADDDSASGTDLMRKVYPNVVSVTADGCRWLTDEEVANEYEPLVEARRQRPDGPVAPLRGE